jgi:hypothetical protein
MESEMKPFVIDRDTWHYKLNKRFFNNYEPWMEQWEARHADFCSYWRATMFRVLFASLAALVILVLFSAFGVMIYQQPIALVVVGVMSGVIGLLVLGVNLLTDVYERSLAKPRKKSESLLAQKYRAYKGKFCPKIEFK